MILDTNALSALLDQDRGLESVVRDVVELCLPVIVLGEYRYGISASRHRAEYEGWLEREAALFRILPVTEETAIHYAVIRRELHETGTPIPANDAWIAALAREHRLPIVSRDTHFDHLRSIQRIGW